jgi:hypothetical protein
MEQIRSDYKRYITNSIKKAQYINKDRVRKIIKENRIEVNDSDGLGPVGILIKAVNEDSSNRMLKIMEEFEYDKSYRYILLYQFRDIDFSDVVNKLQSSELSNKNTLDYYSLSIEKPSIKEYTDSYDLKFSLIIPEGTNNTSDYKYPIVLSLFKDTNIMSIKYDSYKGDILDSRKYIQNVRKIMRWVNLNISNDYLEVKSMSIFKNLSYKISHTPESFKNMSVYYEKMNDEFNGGLTMRADNEEKMSFLDGILFIAKKHGEHVRKDISDYIDYYKNESEMRRIGIIWHVKLKGASKSNKVTVIIRKIYSSNNFMKPEFHHLHFKYNPRLNRERINYVIKYISKNI